MASAAHDEIELPIWLKNKLAIYQKTDPLIAATPTEYQGQLVFYIAPRCCDISSELYDESGHLICYPSGGLNGGDGKCPNFKLQSTR